MTTILCANNRGEVGLTISSPVRVDDDSTSPHVNCLREIRDKTNSKGNKMGYWQCPGIGYSSSKGEREPKESDPAGPDAYENSTGNDHGMREALSATAKGGHGELGAISSEVSNKSPNIYTTLPPTNSGVEEAKFISSNPHVNHFNSSGCRKPGTSPPLLDSLQKGLPNDEASNASFIVTRQMQAVFHGQNKQDNCSFSYQDESCLDRSSNKLIVSSSIPHLLSTSGSMSRFPQETSAPLIAHGNEQFMRQLSFLGTDGALPSPATSGKIRNRGNEPFSFSVTTDDPAFKIEATSCDLPATFNRQCGPPSNGEHPLQNTNHSNEKAIHHPPQSRCVTQDQQDWPSAELNPQLKPSFSGIPLFPPSQNVRSGITPPHHLGSTAVSPPCKVPFPLNPHSAHKMLPCKQIPQQLNLLKCSATPPALIFEENPMKNKQESSKNSDAIETNNTPLSRAVSFQAQILSKHLRAQPHHCHHQPQAIVRPVLYSAINSLEKYNAGSFDNKAILAKMHDRSDYLRAFPGVPKKIQDKSKLVNGFRGRWSSLDSETTAKRSPFFSRAGENNIASSEDNNGIIIESIGSQSKRSLNQEEFSNEKFVISQLTGDDNSNKVDKNLFSVSNKNHGEKVIRSMSSGNINESHSEKISKSNGKIKTKHKGSTYRMVAVDNRQKHWKDPPREKKVGVFRPSCDAYTPRMGNQAIKYKPAEQRTSVEKMSSTMGTIQRPNFRDALRRVAIILHQHIIKIERRFETGVRGIDDTGLFKASMKEYFSEDNFAVPRYKCSIVRVPMARPGAVYSMRKIRVVHTTPTTDEIYEFAHQLFKKVQLSSECSIVCLIYVEKLMEVAKVPLVPNTWRPIFMCGLLLASKVWQDLSSWNIEFASVYPQFSLDAINRLELQFLKFIKWDLYISSSLYAKYYFALRSLLEKSGFRDKYNQMVGGVGGIAASEARKVSKRSEAVKEEALLQLSRSM